MDFALEYKNKLMTADEAVKIVQSGDWVDYGTNLAFPELLDAALAKRKGEVHDVKVRGICVPGPIMVAEMDPERESFIYNSFMLTKYERSLCDRGLCNVIPMVFRNLPIYYRRHLTSNVLMIKTTGMDKHGYFNFSVNNLCTRAMVEAAEAVIVEVDENLPYCFGSEQVVHISEVTAVVEGEHGPLAELKHAPETETDVKIAEQIIDRMYDGAIIQLGIGALPDEIGRQIAKSDLKELGIHTELLVDAYYDMYEQGQITNITKPGLLKGRSVFGFALGTQRLYDWVDQNPTLLTYPINYVNNVQVIAEIDNFVSINNAISVDLSGQINAQSVGTRQISGTGGQLDFVTGAFENPNGTSYIALSSTYTDKKGHEHSRIVPYLKPGETVTDPSSQAYKIVTEYGMVNLAGCSTWERAEKLISIAHPDFRDSLIWTAEKMNVWKRSNKR